MDAATLARHHQYMQKAFVLAYEAFEAGEVPIGCVFVDPTTGAILAKGRNRTNETRNATRHAELVAFDEYIVECGGNVETARQRIRGCVLYVTVEPCLMCAYAMRLLGVVMVVYGAANDRFGGCGSVLRVAQTDFDGVPAAREGVQFEPLPWPDHGYNPAPPYETVQGVCKEEAINLLRRFYMQENPNAPEAKKKTRRELKLLELPQPIAVDRGSSGDGEANGAASS